MKEKKLSNMSEGELIDELCNTLQSIPVDIERVNQLIVAGAYPNEDAFVFAIMTGRLELVEILVVSGADVDYMDDEFYTPLRYAKEALLRAENGEDNEIEGSEYAEIVSYLENLSSQETKNLVEEIMSQNDI